MITNKIKLFLKSTIRFVYYPIRFYYYHLSRNNCVYVSLIGGLGNQLFQYWAGVVLSRKINAKLILDFSAYETFYKTHNFALQFLLVNQNPMKYSISAVGSQHHKLLSVYKEPHFHYDENLFKQKSPVIIEGYWQSYKYFDHIRDEIVSTLKPKQLSSGALEVKQAILNSIQPVSLHIRRGDYTIESHRKVHGLMPFEYYNKAMSMIGVEDSTYFVFTDDVDWVQKNKDKFIYPVTVVSRVGRFYSDLEEIYLMSLCRANVLANSSFSWWGGYLNVNDGRRVIYPKKWFLDKSLDTSDMHCPDWQPIEF